MTKRRIYATINEKNELRSITFYDKDNKRYKQIDVGGTPHVIDGERVIPHVHFGYNHNEGGDYKPTGDEQKLIERIKKQWYNHIGKG